MGSYPDSALALEDLVLCNCRKKWEAALTRIFLDRHYWCPCEGGAGFQAGAALPTWFVCVCNPPVREKRRSVMGWTPPAFELHPVVGCIIIALYGRHFWCHRQLTQDGVSTVTDAQEGTAVATRISTKVLPWLALVLLYCGF